MSLWVSAWFCRLLQVSAGFCGFLRVSAGFCGFLRDSAGFCRIPQVSAGICRSLRVFAGLCGYLQVSAGLCRSLRVFAGLCKSMWVSPNILAGIWVCVIEQSLETICDEGRMTTSRRCRCKTILAQLLYHQLSSLFYFIMSFIKDTWPSYHQKILKHVGSIVLYRSYSALISGSVNAGIICES